MKIIFHSILIDKMNRNYEDIFVNNYMQLLDVMEKHQKLVPQFSFLIENKDKIIISVNNKIYSGWDNLVVSDQDQIDFFVPLAGG